MQELKEKILKDFENLFLESREVCFPDCKAIIDRHMGGE